MLWWQASGHRNFQGHLSLMTRGTHFDEYADSYDVALGHGLAVSGEHKEYFAQGRVAWLARCLREMQQPPGRVMDYGCGAGSSTQFLLDLLGAEFVLGVDTSAKSIELARRAHRSERTRFVLFDQYRPCGEMDLVYCNGVFHHIPMGRRPAAVDYVRCSLRPGGLFALWENNPWNPGARLVMSRIPFDRDAVTLTPPETRHLLRAGGFEVLRTDFLFIFPRALKWLRRIEPLVSRLPLGAQFQVLCRKP